MLLSDMKIFRNLVISNLYYFPPTHTIKLVIITLQIALVTHHYLFKL